MPHRRVEVLAVGEENQFGTLVLACFPSTLILIPYYRDRVFARFPTLVLHLSFELIISKLEAVERGERRKWPPGALKRVRSLRREQALCMIIRRACPLAPMRRAVSFQPPRRLQAQITLSLIRHIGKQLAFRLLEISVTAFIGYDSELLRLNFSPLTASLPPLGSRTPPLQSGIPDFALHHCVSELWDTCAVVFSYTGV